MPVEKEYVEILAVPMGEYIAQLSAVEEKDDGPFGPMIRWDFKITEGPHAMTQLTGFSTPRYSNKSKAYKWAINLGHVPRSKFNSSTIVGNFCNLAVSVETDDEGDQFNKILSVTAMPQGTAPQAAPVPLPTMSTENVAVAADAAAHGDAPVPSPVAAPAAPESGTWNEDEAVPA